MKTHHYIFAVAMLAMLATACEKDNIPVPDNNTNITGGEKDTTSVEEPDDTVINPLSLVNPTIAGMKQSRSGVIEAWTPGNNIGLYYNDNNVSFVYDGNTWNTEQQLEVTTESEVYAYHPYDTYVDEFECVHYDLNDQKDIMWGKTTVSPEFPAAQVEMKHQLSLIRIKLLKDEYIGTGRIDNITFNGRTDFMLSLPLGGYVETDRVGDIRLDDTFILNDANPYIFECMLLPEYDPTNTSFSFNLDGKKLSYQFGAYPRWEEGMIYTYTIKIKGEYGTEINREDVPVDVDFWAQCGKTDDIVIVQKDFSDFENFFSISSNYTFYGYDVYQNEGKPFGLFYSHYGSNPFVGKLRFVLMQGDKIVDKFPPVTLDTSDGWFGRCLPCFVTAAPGKYQLVPLFQREGEITWFKAMNYQNSFCSDNDFMYEVLPPAPDDLPALRDIFIGSVGSNNTGAGYNLDFNKDFRVGFTVSNKGRKAIKGEIKAVWERELKDGSNTYRYGSTDAKATNESNWVDEIGRTKVSIPAGVKFWKDVVDCKITQWHEGPRSSTGNIYCSPIIHLYWKAEGSSEWKLMRLDSDMLMDPEQLSGDQWKVQQFWDSTVNYISTGLKEWINQ